MIESVNYIQRQLMVTKKPKKVVNSKKRMMAHAMIFTLVFLSRWPTKNKRFAQSWHSGCAGRCFLDKCLCFFLSFILDKITRVYLIGQYYWYILKLHVFLFKLKYLCTLQWSEISFTRTANYSYNCYGTARKYQ